MLIRLRKHIVIMHEKCQGRSSVCLSVYLWAWDRMEWWVG